MTGGDLAVRLAWGAVAGSGLQLLVQLPTALRLVGGLRPSLAVGDAGVREVLGNFVPVVFARGAVQISAYVDQILASFLGAAVVSTIGFAQTLYLLPVSLFGMSVSAAELPEMSRLAGTSDDVGAALRGRLEPALERIAFFVIPSTVAFVTVGREIVALLFQSGSFGARDTSAVALVLAGAAIGLPAVTRARLYSSALYALGDPKTPLRVAIARVLAGAGLGLAVVGPLRGALDLSPTMAAAGLVAAGGLVGWIEAIALQIAVRRKIGRTSSRIQADARIWAAALVAGAAGWALSGRLEGVTAIVRSLAVLAAFGVTFLVAARVLGVPLVRLRR